MIRATSTGSAARPSGMREASSAEIVQSGSPFRTASPGLTSAASHFAASASTGKCFAPPAPSASSSAPSATAWSGARERGLLQLKGHKSVGGMRASIYNAMPLAGVQALVDYLREFEKTQA